MNINLGREILNKCQDLEVGVDGRSMHSIFKKYQKEKCVCLRSNNERNMAEAERVLGNEIREVYADDIVLCRHYKTLNKSHELIYILLGSPWQLCLLIS